MTIEFDLTEEDIYELNRWSFRHTPKFRQAARCLQLLFGLIASGVGLILVGAFRRELGGYWLVLPLVGGALGVLFARWFHPRLTRRAIRKQAASGELRQTLGPRRLTLTAEGVEQQTDLNQTKYLWAGIHPIVTTPEGNVYLFVNAGTVALVVPARAFPDAAHRQAFLDTVERYRLAMRG